MTARSGRVSTLISALLAVTLIITLPIILINVSTGRWESWPGMDRLAGPKRFKELLGEVPASVSRLKGGALGPEGGPVQVTFDYEGRIDDLPIVEDWPEADPAEEPALASLDFRHTRVFKRPAGDRGDKYLLFDEQTGRAMLYLPGDRPE